MREILFRGKTDKGEWVQGQLLHFKANVGVDELAVIVEGCEWDNSNEWFNLGKRAKVIPKTVGQYTGLTDKNGTKIFEGDIIIFNRKRNLPNTKPQPFLVFFDERNAQFTRYASPYANLQKDMMSECEVIGNITDNPELLKECEGEMNKYIGKIITSKDGIKGKCIGYLPNTKEFIIQHDKGGRIDYIREGDIDNAKQKTNR